MLSTADISTCGRYRYSLKRIWNEVPMPRLVAFGALNPSTADAQRNDQTIRKEIAFAKAWGMDGLLKWNLYAWRETSPKKLFEASRNYDIIGPDNSAAEIVRLVKSQNVEFVVLGWGTNSNKNYASRIARRGQEVAEALRDAGTTLYYLNANKDGSPQHPLYIPLSMPLHSWGDGAIHGR